MAIQNWPDLYFSVCKYIKFLDWIILQKFKFLKTFEFLEFWRENKQFEVASNMNQTEKWNNLEFTNVWFLFPAQLTARHLVIPPGKYLYNSQIENISKNFGLVKPPTSWSHHIIPFNPDADHLDKKWAERDVIVEYQMFHFLNRVCLFYFWCSRAQPVVRK